jgi:hypothetical protein
MIGSIKALSQFLLLFQFLSPAVFADLNFHPALIRPTPLLIPRGGSMMSSNNSDNNNNTIAIDIDINADTTNATTATYNEDPSLIVGGGAINEKRRQFLEAQDALTTTKNIKESQFDPMAHKSHLFHALEGLDRYPNYLSRWSLEDTETLEQALQERLNLVRDQKQAVVKRRQGFDRLVSKLVEQDARWKALLQPPTTWDEVKSTILDPRASKAIFRSQTFRKHNKKDSTSASSSSSSIPSVQDVLSGASKVELNAGYLQELMEEEMCDVYSFPLLSSDFCETVESYIRAAMTVLETDEEYTHLSRGITKDLDLLGLSWLNDLLFHLVLRPISQHLFQETETLGDLDWRQGYIAAYSASPSTTKPRHRLVPHTDDSEVTLNINIGDAFFEGGLLEMRGLRGMANAGDLCGEYQPQVGRALIHAGRHLHEVTPITSGDRFAYIMWARSWGGTRARTCPCCWMNRRTGDNSCCCICGPRWN